MKQKNFIFSEIYIEILLYSTAIFGYLTHHFYYLLIKKRNSTDNL